MFETEQPATDSTPAVDAATAEGIGEAFDTNEVSTDAELQGEQPEQQTEDDETEDEIEGVKLRGKKEALERLKAERLMQSDYTRKSQDVAEQRKAIEAERALIQQTAQSHQQHIREVAQLVAIDDRISQFANVNWQGLADQDPVQALKLHTEYTQLQAQRAQLGDSLTQKRQQQAQEAERATAKQILQAREVLERDIKGWSPDLAAKLTDYGKTQGYPAEVLSAVTQPAFVKTLHKAFLYDQLVKQRTAKPAATPTPPVGRVSGGNAANTKKLSDLSDAEFAAARRRYIQNNR